jgi:hypothetical protein
MNETEKKSPDAPEADNTQAQINLLRRQVTTLMLALLIASGTFCVYMWRQARLARIDLKNFRVTATQNIQFFQQKQKADFDAFVGKLAEYGKAHADFAPIINKYKISLITNAAPAAATAPQPTVTAPASQPKK